jgi:hypothetical protein
LPDDCQELETLRRFRDDHLLSTPQGSDELRRYYEIAPRIVEGIEATGRARDIYEQIYRLLVSPCVSLIADGRPEEAKILYRSVTEDLSVTFAPGR